MTLEDYSTIQRMLGFLEGIAAGIENKDASSAMYDAIETLSNVIDKLPVEVIDG